MTVLRIRASEIRGQIGEILARIHYRGDHVLVERRGKPIAAIIGIEEYNRLIGLQRQWEADQRRRRFDAIRASAEEHHLSEEEAFQLLEGAE